MNVHATQSRATREFMRLLRLFLALALAAAGMLAVNGPPPWVAAWPAAVLALGAAAALAWQRRRRRE